ncbi:T9SS type A sorting domain-containing protein [Rubrivirga sp.]|uniref:T9SS type A sorting domain-containing protein n=1 Tax=Rubrivirga sp. TaxID=1885344 RepID=UPI003C793BA1
MRRLFLLIALVASPPAQARTCPEPTGHDATLIIAEGRAPDLADGVVVRVTDAQGRCVGEAEWNSSGVALAIRGDDPMTPALDGLREGDPFTVTAVDAADRVLEVSLTWGLDGTSAPAVYQRDRLYLVNLRAPVASVDIVLEGGPGWYQLAAPVEGATVESLLGPLWTQGYPGSDAPEGQATVLEYQESAEGAVGSGYVPIVSSEAEVPSGEGRIVYVYADDDPRTPAIDGGFSKTLSVEGVEPALPFSFSGVTYTPTGDPAGDGWNLLGNPLRTPLALGSEGWGWTNISGAVYVWDPVTREYAVYSTSTGTLADAEVPVGRGFWIHATGPNPSLQAPVGARGLAGARPDTETPMALAQTPGDVVELRLTGEADDGERGANVFAVFGVEGAEAGPDRHDAYALIPPSDSYVVAGSRREDGELLAITALPALPDGGEDQVPIELPIAVDYAALSGTSLTWRWPRVLADSDGWTVTLFDRLTGNEVDLSRKTSYVFDATPPLGTAPPSGSAAMVSNETGVRPARMADAERAAAHPSFVFRTPEKSLRGDEDRFVLRVAPAHAVSTDAAALTSVVQPPAPNPVQGTARLEINLTEPADLEVSVYDMTGRRVALPASGRRSAGRHDVSLEGRRLSAGVYVVRTMLRSLSGDVTVSSHELTVVR